MRPDDGAIDRDEILTALDLWICHHRRRRIHRCGEDSRLAKALDAIVGAELRNRARQFRVERILARFSLRRSREPLVVNPQRSGEVSPMLVGLARKRDPAIVSRALINSVRGVLAMPI